MNNAQEYLNNNFQDKEIKSISVVTESKLKGDLIIQDYSQLEDLNLANQSLTSLILINCPQLKKINVRNNELTKLDLARVVLPDQEKPITNQIEELVAGKNELTSLDLINCTQIKKLMIPDNPTLNDLKNLNLTSLTQVNITNTETSLSQEIQELKTENKRLFKALRRLDEAGVDKELKWVEPIQTVKQVEEAILRMLNKTEQRWREHFEGKKIDELLETRLNTHKKKEQAKQILIWIIETQTNRNYEELIDKWTGSKEWLTSQGEEYDSTNDFDCTLDALIKYFVGLKNHQQKQLQKYESRK
jgi:hypothetical protein